MIDVSCMALSEPDFYGGDQVGTLTAWIESVRELTPSIYSVRLRLVDPVALAFKAGQFVDVEVPGVVGAAPAGVFAG